MPSIPVTTKFPGEDDPNKDNTPLRDGERIAELYSELSIIEQVEYAPSFIFTTAVTNALTRELDGLDEFPQLEFYDFYRAFEEHERSYADTLTSRFLLRLHDQDYMLSLLSSSGVSDKANLNMSLSTLENGAVSMSPDLEGIVFVMKELSRFRLYSVCAKKMSKDELAIYFPKDMLLENIYIAKDSTGVEWLNEVVLPHYEAKYKHHRSSSLPNYKDEAIPGEIAADCYPGIVFAVAFYTELAAEYLEDELPI